MTLLISKSFFEQTEYPETSKTEERILIGLSQREYKATYVFQMDFRKGNIENTSGAIDKKILGEPDAYCYAKAFVNAIFVEYGLPQTSFGYIKRLSK